jgi:IPT/TIG domain
LQIFKRLHFGNVPTKSAALGYPTHGGADGSLFRERARDVGDRQQRDIHHCNFATWNGDGGRDSDDYFWRSDRNQRRRSVHLFGDGPAVTSISPNSGPPAGGTSVTITGGANVD